MRQFSFLIGKGSEKSRLFGTLCRGFDSPRSLSHERTQLRAYLEAFNLESSLFSSRLLLWGNHELDRSGEHHHIPLLILLTRAPLFISPDKCAVETGLVALENPAVNADELLGAPHLTLSIARGLSLIHISEPTRPY